MSTASVERLCIQHIASVKVVYLAKVTPSYNLSI